LRRAGAGNFPIAAAGDAHAVKVASFEKQEESLIDHFICQDLVCGLFISGTFQATCSLRGQTNRSF
jgi:hypothetical protein